jgi:EAL domain-containing protein (putative c-di-GMP-specific phosphodiesterase class I)
MKILKRVTIVVLLLCYLTASIVQSDLWGNILSPIIILPSRAKGIRVIAEGVETEEQWEVIKELQCDEVQGYLFGRPLPPEDIESAFGSDLIRYKKENLT